jgi:2-polyprenyl-6-methoxyphenol hydroxylase-like FAD-dependent oxidoreductase
MWWLPENDTNSHSVVAYYGSGKICGILPFFKMSVGSLFAKSEPHTKNVDDERLRLQELSSDFCKDVQDIVATVPSNEHLYCDDIAYVNMPLWHKGRVVLIGDAQHAVSPVTGMGASMAMEDASVLVEELLGDSEVCQWSR